MTPIVIVQRGVPLLRADFPFRVLPKDGAGYVYVMGRPGRDWIKVGSTRDLHGRLRAVMSESQSPELALYFVLEHAFYRQLERRAHRLLGDPRECSERFWVAPERAIEAIKQTCDSFVSTRDGTSLHD